MSCSSDEPIRQEGQGSEGRHLQVEACKKIRSWKLEEDGFKFTVPVPVLVLVSVSVPVRWWVGVWRGKTGSGDGCSGST